MSSDSTGKPQPQEKTGDAARVRPLGASLNRRGFMVAGSTMLLAAVVDACTSEGLRSQRGVVRLILTGLDPAATTGGSAIITKSRSTTSLSVDVPPLGEATVPVDIGDYSVVYTAPQGYLLPSGDTTETRNVSVDLDVVTTATFSIVQEAIVGTVQVTVTGLVGIDGGTVTLERTDAAAATRFIPISAAGTGSSPTIPAGTYTATYSPPPGYLDTSVTNPVAGLVVTAGAPTAVSFAVAVAPGNIHVEVNGIAGAPSGGQLVATPTAGGTPSNLSLPAPSSGQSVGDLSALTAGGYTLTYTPPAGYELIESSPASRSVTVPAGGTSNVTFDGRIIPGNVSVSVSGLAGAFGGGQVTLVRTDGTGSSFQLNLSAPVGGASSGSIGGLPPGSYNASYTPPAGYQLASPSPVVVTVASAATAPVAFTTTAISGAIRLQVEGLDPSAPNGGTAQVLRTDVTGQTPIDVAIPVSGAVDTTVQPGAYSITYAPPAGHQLGTGQANPRSASVVGGQTATAAFQVAPIPADGTLHITVQGLLPSATGGGTLAILRTDIAGQTPVNVDIPVTGTLDRTQAAGAYSLTYTAPAGHQLVAGQQNPRSVGVSSSQTTDVTYQVAELPPPLGVIFHSDFSTATGTSDAALLDSGKGSPWDLWGGQGLEVIPSTGLDFPTANVLRVMALTASSGFAALRKTGMPVPAVGESRFYRWYIRAGANIEDGNTHPIQDGANAGSSNWQFELLHTIGGANKWTVQFKMGAVAQNFNNQNYRGPALDCNVTYRFEIQVHRISASTYNFHVRVYNSANVLLYGDADFRNIDTGGTLANQSPAGQFGFLNPANLDGLNAGCNGVGPLSSDRLYAYQAAFAISGTDWLGPYAGGI